MELSVVRGYNLVCVKDWRFLVFKDDAKTAQVFKSMDEVHDFLDKQSDASDR